MCCDFVYSVPSTLKHRTVFGIFNIAEKGDYLASGGKAGALHSYIKGSVPEIFCSPCI